MIDFEYKMIVKKFIEAISDNRTIIKSAIEEELNKNLNKINFENVLKILSEYDQIAEDDSLKGKRVAIVCKGDPETTIQIMLAALKNDIHVKLVTLNYHIINNCLFTLYSEVLQDMRIPNVYFNYHETYMEQDIIQRNKSFEKVIYIGSYFDYKNFEYFCNNENLVFWNDNHIKILMPRTEYKEEYKEIVKYAYANNIEIEVYDDEDDFFEELQEGEFAIIYTEENARNFLDKMNPRIVRFNEFNIEDFKFNINDLILGIDFSIKV